MNSIYQGKATIIALAEVQHCDKLVRKEKDEAVPNGLHVITSKTAYNREWDGWENAAYVPQDEAEQFLKEWYAYRRWVETLRMEVHPGLRTDVPFIHDTAPRPDLQKKVRYVVHGDVTTTSMEVWVKHGGRKIKLQCPRLTGQSPEDLFGSVIEFREAATRRFDWLAPGEYEVVSSSAALRPIIQHFCVENLLIPQQETIALGDELPGVMPEEALRVLGARYNIDPPDFKGEKTVGDIICAFAEELYRRGNPGVVERDGEKRCWQILNHFGSVVDEFTCERDPLCHYAFKTQLSLEKLKEMNCTARPVRSICP